MYNNLMGGCQEDGVRFFSLMPSNRMRGNEHKLEDREFRLAMRKNVFSVRVAEHQHRLPRETVQTLEILKGQLDTLLCDAL